MTTYAFCDVQREGHLLVVTINRPEVMNALHRPASLELEQVFDRFQADPELWVSILTGSGERAFSAGNDLKFQAQGNDITLPPTGFGGLTGRLDLTKPVIAAVNGLAFGGGFELALACDLVIAARNATFALPEPRVGMAAAAGGLLRLPRQIPMKHAMGIILTGRRVSADEGYALGFVNEVVEQGGALPTARRWADEILQASPMAIRAAKELVRAGQDHPLHEIYPIQKTLPEVAALYSSQDNKEGPRAFAEKRKPNWVGR